ncbi:hypothetical protein FHR74_003348 [Sphingomonas aerolata]|nr:hypothetical protein [Sphingomonas aerolata]
MTNPVPMDLENMRSLGIRTIDLICSCERHMQVNVDTYPGTNAAPSPHSRLKAKLVPGYL